MPPNKARFLTGSPLRHVVVMALTGSVGLMFMFLIDVATLFWVSRLGVERYVAALGFAWTIQFFTISVGLGFGIAATALVSRAIGAGETDRARELGSAAIVLSMVLMILVAVGVVLFRHEIVGLAGGQGETAEVAARFLMISVPSLPLIALAMATASILRATGDAVRSTAVTLSAGLFAMVVDPIAIFWLGLGVDGAAVVVVLSRTVSGLLGLYFVVRVYDLVGPVRLTTVRTCAPALLAIAGPGVLMQISAPVSNAIVTNAAASFGDAAVAGWSVASRMTFLAFGGLFALNAAIGGIFGQNYGARKFERLQSAYRAGILYSVVYVAIAWTALVATEDLVAQAFNLSPEGAAVYGAFAWLGSAAFVFYGFLAVGNSSFNSLGRPLWATGFNWLRDLVLVLPLATLGASLAAAPGAVYGQAAAAVLAGTICGWVGWRFVVSLAPLAETGDAPKSALAG